MSEIKEMESFLRNATGEFIYTDHNGSYVDPRYKFAYFGSASDPYAVFVGRDATTGQYATGVYITFMKGLDFADFDVPVSPDVSARFDSRGAGLETVSGRVSGMFSNSRKKAVIAFDFITRQGSSSWTVKGYLRLSA